MKITAAIAAATVVTVGLVETTFRLRENPSDEMAGKMVKVAVAKQCPETPGTLRDATLDALAYSFVDPSSLPPWHVLIAAQRMEASAADNPVSQIACGAMREG